jgi:cytochrome c oxidase cbb3-type subunit 2
MSRTWWVYAVALAAGLASLAGLVFVPQWQLGGLRPITDESGASYPEEPSGAVAAGRQVYIRMGCVYCHSQQVRPGSDVERGWGGRRSTARDCLVDAPPLLGTMRTGPDLACIGTRQPSADWHYIHLYRPRRLVADSLMPPHAFMFETLAAADVAADAGLALAEGEAMPGALVVPSESARALVAYLLSLQRGCSGEEAPQ